MRGREGPVRRSLDEGPRAKARGRNTLGFAKLEWERDPMPSCSWHYIGNVHLHTTPWWGRILQAATLNPIGPFKGGVDPYSIWAPLTVAPQLLGYGKYYMT
jgi:hypothetical protein